MQRYKFTEKNVKQAISALKGEKGKTPKFYTKYKDKLTTKDGKLFYEKKEVVPKSNIDKVLRSLLYDKGSAVPWSRDSGYADLSKRFTGISKRAFADFVSRQRVKIETDNVPPKIPKKGRNLSKKGTVEIDLYQISRIDLPKEIKASMQDTLDKNPQQFVLTMVEKLTSLTYLHFLGGGAKAKSRARVMPWVRKGGKWIADKIGVPEASLRYLRDKGGEFAPPSELKGRTIKLGPAVEARNSFAQRVMHRLLKAKRGHLTSVIKQTQGILNNTKSTVSKVTPNEAAAKTNKELAPKYNAKRTIGKIDNYKKLKIGDMVRLVTKDPKGTMYKAYKGKQWSKAKYRIDRVGKKKPYRYHVSGKWKARDQISNAEKQLDQESEKLLKGRTQSGDVRKKYEKKPKKPDVIAPRKRSARAKRVDYAKLAEGN